MASPSTSVPTRSTTEVDGQRAPDHLHRHPGSRGVHRHACPWLAVVGHRGPRGRGRRRRDAADGRGAQPRQGRRRADRGRGQQDRQARRRPDQGPWPAHRVRPGARGVRRRRDVRRRLGQVRAQPRQAARGDRADRRRVAGPAGQPRPGRPGPRRSRRTSTAVAARWPRCWSSAARCGSATRSWPVRPTAGSGRCSTSTARTSRRPTRAVRRWCSVSTAVPGAGQNFIVVEDDRMARQIAEKREARERAAMQAKRRVRRTLEDFMASMEKGESQELNLILKGDVSGSVEALEDCAGQDRRRRRGVAARHRPRCRCDHRDQRRPGRSVRRDHHRLQRPPAGQGDRAGGHAKASRSATTRSSTRRSRRSRRPSRACSSRSSRSRPSARRRSARSSARRSSATSPAAWSPAASSGATPRCASSATARSWPTTSTWPR